MAFNTNNNNANEFVLPPNNNKNDDDENDYDQPYAPPPYYDDNSVILQDSVPLEPLSYQREDIDQTVETTTNDTNAVKKTDAKRRLQNKKDAQNSAKRKKDRYAEAAQKREELEQEVDELVLSNQNTECHLRNGAWLYISHNMRTPYTEVNWQLVDDNLEVFHQEKRQNYMDFEARRARDEDLNQKRELENIAQFAASDAFEDNHAASELVEDLMNVLSEPNKERLSGGTLASRQTRKKQEHEYASNVFHISWNEHEKQKQVQLKIILERVWSYYRPFLQKILERFGDYYHQEAARMNRLVEFERMRGFVFPPLQEEEAVAMEQ